MSELKRILMERDSISPEEADELIEEAACDLDNRMLHPQDYDNNDVLMDHFGLEDDYIMDIMR